jgi:predicted nucleic acid-binding protein
MRLLVDTTYLLPAVGVWPRGASVPITELLARTEALLISEITFFELSAKGSKYVSQGTLKMETVTDGIKAVLNDGRITIIPLLGTLSSSTPTILRGIIDDYIDCIILAAAIQEADALVTEDELLLSLRNDPSFHQLRDRINPKFRIMKMSQILHE